MAQAWLYDGESAVRRPVGAEQQGDRLLIRFEDGDTLALPPSRLVHIESRPDLEIYGRTDAPGWRLRLPGTAAAELAPVLPRQRRYGGFIDRIGLLPSAALLAAVSAAIIFGGTRLPQWLAPHIPAQWEEDYGDALVGDFGGKYCNGAGGQAALNRLAAKLSPAAGTLNIRVVDINFANAAALPGGNIVIFEELLAESECPDEVAGVLAHEIAHVERRHVTQAMIRDLGLGLVVSAFGGTTGGSIDGLLSAGYSRGSEREADDDAIAMLRRAGISPLPTAQFFNRMAEQEAKLGGMAEGLSYVSTHPLSAERRQRFRDSAEKGRNYQAALSRDEWEALFNICFNDADRRRAKGGE
ncbi:MAG TPA: M48 family metallopeptidase [Allosphingosinicella sp.]|nr:M48 family metallopeptidase [Allosphingosinicella sp.]